MTEFAGRRFREAEDRHEGVTATVGFTFSEIRQLLELRLDPRRSSADVRAEAERKIESGDWKLTSLRVCARVYIK